MSKIDSYAHLLGKMSDPDIAKASGYRITSGYVAECRRKRGIPAFTPKTKWSPQNTAKLGTMTDTALAKELGVSHQRVAKKRAELGIAKFDSRRSTL